MASVSSSLTQLSVPEEPATAAANDAPPNDHAGRKPSAMLEDEKEESVENHEDDWKDAPENPRNWSFGKKWNSAGVVSFYTFVPPLSSIIMAPGLQEIAIMYSIASETVVAMTLSIFLIGLALGVCSVSVLHLNNIIAIAFYLGCAFAPNAGALLAFRFLGHAPIAISAGVVSDLFVEQERAAAIAMISLGPLIGPVVGPISGGFVAEKIGVKWVFIIVAALGGVAGVYGIFCLRETYAPVFRLRKAKASGDPEAAEKHPPLPAETSSKLNYIWVNLSRPTILLFGSVICFLLSLYMAFLYGIYYLMFTTFSTLFSDVYGFDTGISGLTYIGLGVGFFIATFLSARVASEIYLYLSKKNGGKGEPEMRIPPLVIGSLFVPFGLFWYGWSAQAKIHWIMPIIGSGIFGFGMMCAFLPIQLYLVDTFTYAASALSAASVFRSLLGFAFPLFGEQIFDKLGNGGGNSLLGGLAIVLGIPFPIYLYYRGADIRKRSRLTR
ncbi:major facilitator superfamily domain-containing protein [Mycena pura]|uniref:Major facilitator superfamily domain-containing protein n=1 Tax=Mycena pura TaxID=153505 RepID=A0AAD7E4Z6_9AGAR|nr:major facilitator superfamily domain-containing protein [Mycena pura]